MTRIDTINVKYLTDQHLISNYREITRVSKDSRFPKKNEKFPSNYKLNEGHVKFFFDKGEYLKKRTQELYDECINRGFNVQYKEYRLHRSGLDKDFTPCDNDHEVCIGRLLERLESPKKPYRYYGKVISYEEYYELLKGKYEFL